MTADAATTPDFGPVAATLRKEVRAFYANRPGFLDSPPGARTLDTNSSLAERRGGLLLEMLASECEFQGLGGARVLDVGCGFGALSVFFAAQGASVTGIDLVPDRFEV